MIGAKPLRIRFDKIDGFIKVYDGTRYLVLFVGEKYDFIYNRIRYLIQVKRCIMDFISHNYVKIKKEFFKRLLLSGYVNFEFLKYELSVMEFFPKNVF